MVRRGALLPIYGRDTQPKARKLLFGRLAQG